MTASVSKLCCSLHFDIKLYIWYDRSYSVTTLFPPVAMTFCAAEVTASHWKPPCISTYYQKALRCHGAWPASECQSRVPFNAFWSVELPVHFSTGNRSVNTQWRGIKQSTVCLTSSHSLKRRHRGFISANMRKFSEVFVCQYDMTDICPVGVFGPLHLKLRRPRGSANPTWNLLCFPGLGVPALHGRPGYESAGNVDNPREGQASCLQAHL